MNNDKPSVDFGWRFMSRPVGILPDQTVGIASNLKGLEQLLRGYCPDPASLRACLQCGACTATCNLTEEGSLFPRRQMTLLHMGQKERLLKEVDLWRCHACGDCSTRCPQRAHPGALMAGLRWMAIEHFTAPRFLAPLARSPRLYLLAYPVAALALALAVTLGGSWSPSTQPVVYASFLPHLTLNLTFFLFTALALLAMGTGIVRAGNAFTGERFRELNHHLLRPAFFQTLKEIAAHRRFSDCEEHTAQRVAHTSMMFSFIGLFVLTGVVVLLLLAGGAYPFPPLHPLKLVGNAFALGLLGSSLYFMVRRVLDARAGMGSTSFDWLLLVNIFLIGLSGVLLETFRWVGWAGPAYPVYFLHLVLVLVLIGTLPYSKLAHVVYRTLALTMYRYRAMILARRQDHTTYGGGRFWDQKTGGADAAKSERQAG